ncbi:allantoate deiminase [Evansella vedderi]|uniref:Allantoate deiminase n=1 Tax=Evansella vedderi TaxID=38282 RepID=A0ABT9ZP32_9BACI|nr:Zn-dependent hydrolase [Evansella vedderi]MDQ0252996.1 allantoate deiminase [Evansella vedderi]
MSTVIQLDKFYTALVSEYDKALNHSGINGERVAERLTKLSQIGLTEQGGSRRIAFTPEERQAKELVKEWMKEAGLDVREDGAGNVFGLFEGKQQKPVVLSGSHVDSVPNGGHFDGPLGVLAALEVAQAWRDSDYQPDYSYEVVIFSDEEGARFNGGLTGSRAMTGDIDIAKQKHLKDFDGKSFEEVIVSDGLTMEGFQHAERDLSDVAAFVEVHIEQGKRLEKEDLPVGIVTGIAGPTWLNIAFVGEAGHAGNTPMNDRKDALVAASEFVANVPNFPSQVSDSAVATVGKLEVFPNGVNVIPGEVRLTVDIRDIHEHTKDQVVTSIIQTAEEIAADHQIEVQVKTTMNVQPVAVKEEMQEKAALSVQEALGIQPFHLPSGAGHDAMALGRYVPMAMLFTRSKDGISHNPKEWSSLNDCVKTIHVLKNYLEKLCQE